MQPGKPTGRGRLWFRFLVGLFYLTCVAALFAAITGSNFLIIWLAVFLGAILVGILALAWLTGWAEHDDSRLGQFGIRSLFFLTALIAIFFSVVRWLAVNLSVPGVEEVGDSATIAVVCVVCLFLFAFGVPLMIGFMESLVWAAVWIVRRQPIRRWFLRRREHQASRFDEDA